MREPITTHMPTYHSMTSQTSISRPINESISQFRIERYVKGVIGFESKTAKRHIEHRFGLPVGNRCTVIGSENMRHVNLISM